MPYIDLLFDYFDRIAVAFGVGGIVFDYLFKRDRIRELKDLLPRLFAYSMIPMGIAFIICAFRPELLDRLSSINIYIAAAGCSILYLARDSLRK